MRTAPLRLNLHRTLAPWSLRTTGKPAGEPRGFLTTRERPPPLGDARRPACLHSRPWFARLPMFPSLQMSGEVHHG